MENIKPFLSFEDKYRNKIDQEGYIRLGDIDRSEFGGRQIKNIASFLDGSEGENLGDGLNYTGNSGNYSDMKININDLKIFIDRVKEFYK